MIEPQWLDLALRRVQRVALYALLVCLVAVACTQYAHAGASSHGQCFSDAQKAAQFTCATDYPQMVNSSATSQQIISCASVTGTVTAPVLNLQRITVGTATVTVLTASPVYAPCADQGGNFEGWAVAAYVVMIGVGYIGGRLR